MTLDEALRQARIAVDAPHPAGYIGDSTFVSRAVLRQVLDELAATSRGVMSPAATVAVVDYVRLRDQFAMHAPEPSSMPDCYYHQGRPRVDDHSLEERECAHALARFNYADAMMAARGTK